MMMKNEFQTNNKSGKKQIPSTTHIIFYSLLCKDDFLEKYGLSKNSSSFDRLLKIQPMLNVGDDGLEVIYTASYDFVGQPYLVTLKNLKKFIKNPPVVEEEAGQSCPYLTDGDFELDLNDFIPVKIILSDLETEGSIRVNALQINSKHPDYDLKANKIISYRDEAPADEVADDWFYTLRELLVVKDKEFMKEFPFYLGTLKESEWQNKEEFPKESLDKINLFITIETLMDKEEKPSKKIKEQNRDLWLKKMGDIPPMKPEDERFSWMEYFDTKDNHLDQFQKMKEVVNDEISNMQKVITDKFINVPIEQDTTILFNQTLKVENYDVLYQIWAWESTIGRSIIFVSKEVGNLTDEEIKIAIKKLPFFNDKSDITLKRSKSGYTFVNFNFETAE